MALMSWVKRVIPSPIKRLLHVYKDARAQRLQFKRFLHWMSLDTSSDKARIETRLAFDIHRLETGLSHTHFRDGFGQSVLREISKRMVMLQHVDRNYPTNSLYMQAIAALHEYQQHNVADGYDLSEIRELFPPDIWNGASTYEPMDSSPAAGSFVLARESKANNLEKSFIDLAAGRYSVREYASTPVSQQTLDKVYSIAMKTPSVCNRQSARIYQISDADIIESALKLQGGFHGYDVPPILLFITSDIRAFMNADERNEPFVDGGLFAMTLLYALEAYGLAACPLNAMFTAEVDAKTRELLQVPDYELPVMYIAVGNFPKEVPVCRSTRRDVESVLTIIG